MSTMASQITSVSIVWYTVCSGADRRKHQNSVSLAFVSGIHRWPVESPHKWAIKAYFFHLMTSSYIFINELRLCLNYKPSDFPLARLIPWLQISWRFTALCHQQPCYYHLALKSYWLDTNSKLHNTILDEWLCQYMHCIFKRNMVKHHLMAFKFIQLSCAPISHRHASIIAKWKWN